jgi:DNA-directed RNA polymerase subunit RPC12/RpoP
MNATHCSQCGKVSQDYLNDIVECHYCMADLREGEG